MVWHTDHDTICSKCKAEAEKLSAAIEAKMTPCQGGCDTLTHGDFCPNCEEDAAELVADIEARMTPCQGWCDTLTSGEMCDRCEAQAQMMAAKAAIEQAMCQLITAIAAFAVVTHEKTNVPPWWLGDSDHRWHLTLEEQTTL